MSIDPEVVVLPAHAGMIRELRSNIVRRLRAPRSRGDDPVE